VHFRGLVKMRVFARRQARSDWTTGLGRLHIYPPPLHPTFQANIPECIMDQRQYGQRLVVHCTNRGHL
jgi:hypothetical protein